MNLEKLNSFILADTERCVGCRTCEIACALAHMEAPPTVAGQIGTRLVPRVFVVNLSDASAPIICRHCEDAPCSNVCKMGAISRQGERVVVDTDRCVGCRLCLMACPFGAIEFAPLDQHAASVFPSASLPGAQPIKIMYRANKCDLCFGRAEGPACIANCPEEALQRVDASKASRRRRSVAALELQAGHTTALA
ncbi:MAG: 4Fe-4S dicluster domain-containing protein [Acidobacteriota bacterium]|nr:4Fe-4S dicluster domain-containing protein [Acidobacteriota bacterium]